MKFKNIKKKIKQIRFPSNSRTITDSKTLLRIYRGTLKVFIALIFTLAIIIVGVDLDANIREKQFIDLEREELIRELEFWESFIAKHDNYRDGYFQASILEYKLGNNSKAKKYMEKGLSLDPNSQDGRKIEEFLNKSSIF